ncbi:MAG: Ku protein [Candidatus Eisenbacteria bacterium]|nr:Ku protein [Candidatus Eisenbacteria bacterium]
MAPRPIWSGAISFGLVNVPVNLFPALRPHGVHLRMLDPSGTPLNRRYVSSNSGEPIDPDHIVRGYEVEKGKFVLVSDEELEALEPQRSREIDLRRFVDVSTIPPYYFERPYFLTPAGRSNKAYRLLAAVMEKEGKAGLATFVMREKEYLVAILWDGGILRAQTLRFADEIRSPEDVGLPERKPARAKQVAKIGKTIRDRTKSRLAREDLGDDVTAKLEKLIEKKVAQGRDIVTLEATPESKAEFVDLMEVLKQRMRGAA